MIWALSGAHQLELVDPGDRRVQESEAIFAPLHLQHRVRGSVDGEDIPDETMIGEMLEERLAPPLGVRSRIVGVREFTLRVVDVLVNRDPVVQPAVVHDQRDVVGDVKGSVLVIGADAGQSKTLSLVTHVGTPADARVSLRIVDGINADHALVHIRAGVVHSVVVKPEEALLLPVVPTGGPIQVQIIDEHPRKVTLVSRPAGHRVVRVAVALRRRVSVVQVGEKGHVRCPEVLPVQPQRVLVQVVLETDKHRFSVFGVDPRPGKRSVEAVDRAERQRADRPGGVGPARRIERGGLPAVIVDRQHLRGGERMDPHQQVDLVDDRVRETDLVGPDLMLLVAQRILLARSGPWRLCPIGNRRHRYRCQCSRDGQRVNERRQDQRAGREPPM